MQTVMHDYVNASTIFNQIEWLYSYISDNIGRSLFPIYLDTSFDELCDTLKDHIPDFDGDGVGLVDCPFPQIPVPDTDDVIVCISGGKDSVALTKMLIDCGKKVHLYHMHGINKVYSDEYTAVIETAKYFKVPYHIDTIVLSGSQRFVEHPMKNMIIANGAIHYGLRENIGVNIAFGNFNESYLEGNQFEVCGGDCMDMWYAYERIIRKIIPTFSVSIPLNNNQESLEIIEHHPELLLLSVSCISPYRFRNYWKKRTEKSYVIQLLPNRCGCCWKCCVEYMYYADRDVLEYNEPYYLHCIEVLYNTLKKESNVTGTIEQIWAEYMHYPIKKSKAWEVLKNATIQNGKVRCIQ